MLSDVKHAVDTGSAKIMAGIRGVGADLEQLAHKKQPAATGSATTAAAPTTVVGAPPAVTTAGAPTAYAAAPVMPSQPFAQPVPAVASSGVGAGVKQVEQTTVASKTVAHAQQQGALNEPIMQEPR